jgi:hypothetical protein
MNLLESGEIPNHDRLPQIAGLITDDRGHLWVKSYNPQKDALSLKTYSMSPSPGGEWRVVRPDGAIVTTVRMPEGVRPLEIKGNRMLGVSTDEFGVERLVVHTIRQ